MKKQNNLGLLLALITGIALLAAVLLRTFLPRLILPNLDGGNVVLLSLAALTADFYLSKEKKHDYRLVPLYGALVFGLLPFAACFTAPLEALKLAVLGAVLFTAVSFLFDSISDRLSTGPAAKAAPIFSALGLYLAAQCLMGII